MKQMGRRGGLATAAKMTEAEKKARARKAGKASARARANKAAERKGKQEGK